MQNNNNVFPPLVGFACCAVVVASVLQGMGAWASKLGKTLEPLIKDFQHWVLLALVVFIIALFLYGFLKAVLLFNDFVNRVDIRGIGHDFQLKELKPKVEGYQMEIWSLESDLGKLRERIAKLEEEAKKAKENPNAVIGAAVSEIVKG